jgi:hypothetical protein
VPSPQLQGQSITDTVIIIIITKIKFQFEIRVNFSFSTNSSIGSFIALEILVGKSDGRRQISSRSRRDIIKVDRRQKGS